MFGKIFVQEFRNTWRIPVIFSCVAVVLSFIVRMEMEYLDNAGFRAPKALEIFINIFVFMYIIYMIAASAIVVFSMPVRFYRESFGDQGYLYHSLPITKSAFFGAHVLVNCLWLFFYSVVMYCSLSIVFNSWGLFKQTIGFLFTFFTRELRTVSAEDPVIITLLIILLVIYLLMSLVETVVMANCAVCLGQNFRKHRTAGAVLMYFLLSFIIGIANQILGGSNLIGRVFEAQSVLMSLRRVAILLAVSVAVQLVEIIIMWIISTTHMTKHLNLE